MSSAEPSDSLATTLTGHRACWPPLLLATAHTGHHTSWPPRILVSTLTGHHSYWPPLLLATALTDVARLLSLSLSLEQEAKVYDFEPTDSMDPAPNYLELAQEFEMLMYGASNFYQDTLGRIADHTADELAQKHAAMLLQRVARRHAAVAERRKRFLEKSSERAALGAMGLAAPALGKFSESPNRGKGSERYNVDASELLERLEADERATAEAMAASSDAHAATLESSLQELEELERAQRAERAMANANLMLKKAATTLQRAGKAFVARARVRMAEAKHKKFVTTLLANLPPRAEQHVQRIASGYRRMLHVQKALTLQLGHFDLARRMQHPGAIRSLYSHDGSQTGSHGLTTVHQQLEAALAELRTARAAREWQRKGADVADVVDKQTRTVRRLRGAISLIRAIAEYRPGGENAATGDEQQQTPGAPATSNDAAADFLQRRAAGERGGGGAGSRPVSARPGSAATSGEHSSGASCAAFALELERRLSALRSLELTAHQRLSRRRRRTAAARRTQESLSDRRPGSSSSSPPRKGRSGGGHADDEGGGKGEAAAAGARIDGPTGARIDGRIRPGGGPAGAARAGRRRR